MSSFENLDPFLSIKLNNGEQQFLDISDSGTHGQFHELPYCDNIITNHVQGYTQCGDDTVCILTHSMDSGGGCIFIQTNLPSSRKKTLKFRTENGWNHPGGIQTIGQYLFVPCEKSKKSRVFVYSLAELNQDKLPLVKVLDFKHEAGALGITDFTINNEPYYLLLIGDQNTYHGYIAKVPKDISQLSFGSVGDFYLVVDGEKIQCQGFGLVTDVYNRIYMVALVSFTSFWATTYDDCAHLLMIHVTSGVVGYSNIKMKRHFYSKGGISGVDGTHFRWGAGIRIQPREKTGKLVVLGTSRNIIAGTFLDSNHWI